MVVDLISVVVGVVDLVFMFYNIVVEVVIMLMCVRWENLFEWLSLVDF